MARRYLSVSTGILALLVALPAVVVAQALTYITQWVSPVGFNLPSGVAVDGAGIVYVADYGNGRVQKLTSNGTLLTYWDVVVECPHSSDHRL